MNEFLRRNKRLLSLYCKTAVILGWLLWLIAVIVCIISVRQSLVADERWTRIYFLLGYPPILLTFVFMGVFAHGFAQFIRYVYESDYRVRWTLRHASQILYLYAVITVVNVILGQVKLALMPECSFPMVISSLAIQLPLALTWALIFLGLAQLLRRLMPMIEESKTLV